MSARHARPPARRGPRPRRTRPRAIHPRAARPLGPLRGAPRDVERLPDHEMGASRLLELVRLYRQTCSDLNEARSYTANPELLARLNDLAGRGYRLVYRRSHGRRLAGRGGAVLLERRPRAPFAASGSSSSPPRRRCSWGPSSGFGAVLADRGNGERLIPGEFFTESPARAGGEDRARRRSASARSRRRRRSGPSSSPTTSRCRSWPSAWARSGSWGAWPSSSTTASSWARSPPCTCSTASRSSSWPGWGPTARSRCPPSSSAERPGLRLGRALLFPGDLSTGASLRAAFPSVWRMLLTTASCWWWPGSSKARSRSSAPRPIPYSLKIARGRASSSSASSPTSSCGASTRRRA